MMYKPPGIGVNSALLLGSLRKPSTASPKSPIKTWLVAVLTKMFSGYKIILRNVKQIFKLSVKDFYLYISMNNVATVNITDSFYNFTKYGQFEINAIQ